MDEYIDVSKERSDVGDVGDVNGGKQLAPDVWPLARATGPKKFNRALTASPASQ